MKTMIKLTIHPHYPHHPLKAKVEIGHVKIDEIDLAMQQCVRTVSLRFTQGQLLLPLLRTSSPPFEA